MPLPEPILEKLRSAQSGRRLVAYHQWSDDPTIFLVGFVLEIKTDRILFDMVGTCGEPENKVDVVDIDDIQWLDFDSDYLLGLERLYPRFDELIGKKPRAGIRVTSRQAIERNLRAALESREVVLIELQQEKRDALIIDVQQDFFCFTELRDGGRPDGESWMRIDLIQVLKRKTDRQIADRFLYEQFRAPDVCG